MVDEFTIAVVSGLIAGGTSTITALVMTWLNIIARRQERRELFRKEDRDAAFRWFDRIFEPLAPFLCASFELRGITEILTNANIEVSKENRISLANTFDEYGKIVSDNLHKITERGYVEMLPDDIVKELFKLMTIVEKGKRILEKDPELEEAGYDEFGTLLTIVEACHNVRNMLRKLFRVDSLDLCNKKEGPENATAQRQKETPELWILGIWLSLFGEIWITSAFAMVDAFGLKLWMLGLIFIGSSFLFVYYVTRVARKYFGATTQQINKIRVVVAVIVITSVLLRIFGEQLATFIQT